MARVKATTRRSQGPPKPRIVVSRQPVIVSDDPSDTDDETDQQQNMSSKRQASPDVNLTLKKARSASSSSPTNASSSGPSSMHAPVPAPAPALPATVSLAPPEHVQAHSSATHRYFMQIFILDAPWDPNGDKEAWMLMDRDHCHIRLETQAGINFMFYSDGFKVIPYGPKMTNITDSDNCGYDIAPGFSVMWKYNRMFHHQYADIKRAFIVVKLPISNPNPPVFTKNDSATVDAAVRQMFRTLGPPDLTMPCWFPKSQAERERDYWKALYESKKRGHEQCLRDYDLLDAKLIACEAKLHIQTVALKSIEKAVECAICLHRFSSNEHCMMASCGHLVHKHCHKKLEDDKKADTCVTCQGHVRFWLKFHGFTAISDSVAKAQAALSAD